MKRFLYAMLFMAVSAIGMNATVLFPHFVDIAPNYEDGLTEELRKAGVTCGMYHSIKPGFMASSFTEVESFFADTLPSDVTREEKKIGDSLLVIYTSVNTKSDDTIETTPLKSTIYVLHRPDNSFVAAYCEEKMEK